MSRYAKAIAALCSLIGTWGMTAALDDGITAVELFGLLAAIGGSAAVWSIPNDPLAGEPADPGVSERGASDLAIVLGALIIGIALVLAFGTETR